MSMKEDYTKFKENGELNLREYLNKVFIKINKYKRKEEEQKPDFFGRKAYVQNSRLVVCLKKSKCIEKKMIASRERRLSKCA